MDHSKLRVDGSRRDGALKSMSGIFGWEMVILVLLDRPRAESMAMEQNELIRNLCVYLCRIRFMSLET